MAHKTKGTYVNCVNGKYYLYAAHSQRVPGTSKVRRVTDGYIGRITQEGGLIPKRDNVSGDVRVYEYGLCMTMLGLCGDIAKGFRREFRGASDRILVSGLLSAAYGSSDQETYGWSFLSVKFPGIEIGKEPTIKQGVAIERCGRMAADVMARRFGEGAGAAAAKLSMVCVAKVNGRMRPAKMGEGLAAWLSSNGIDIDWSEING
jgi:hypothetical protein